MNPDSLAAHLDIAQYGDFTLTDAIRPGPGLPVRPREGYRIETYRDRKAKLRLPMLSAAVSAERVFETFLALMEPVGEVVHAVLESSHGRSEDAHRDFRRSHIDLPVLMSHFCDFEELLTHQRVRSRLAWPRNEASIQQFEVGNVYISHEWAEFQFGSSPASPFVHSDSRPRLRLPRFRLLRPSTFRPFSWWSWRLSWRGGGSWRPS